MQAQLEQLQKDMEAQKIKADKSAMELAAAKASVSALAVQRAAETAGSQAAAEALTPSEKATEAAEGFVSVAFAEAKWTEREQQFAEQMAALQALVAGGGQEGSASTAPSEASDTQDAASLDIEIDDDSWKKVDREVRKTIAAKHRTVLAGKVATSIGKVAKAASPFQKTAKKC